MRLPPKLWNLLASRKTRIALACAPFAFCLLVLLFYFGTSWWGRSQAKRHLQEFESAGYVVDPEKYWIPAVNSQDDLFQDPLFQQELKNPELASLVASRPKMSRLAQRQPKSEPSLARVTDLVRWIDPPTADERAAAEILLKEHHVAVERLEALRPVLSRSKEAVWPVKMVHDNLGGRIELATVAESMLQLKSSAEATGEIAVLHLGAGEAGKAAEAVVAMLDIARLEMDPKPTLVSVIIADTLLRRTQTVIWEGVVRGGWSDDQLQSFDKSLVALRPQQAAVKSSFGEIAFLRSETKGFLAAMRALPEVHLGWRLSGKWDPSATWESTKKAVSELRPPGFELADGVKSHREFLEGVARSGEAPRERFTPEDLAKFRRMSEASSGVDSRYFVSGGKALSFLATSALRMETAIALTRTGIALERYRLRTGNGAYPASLETLVPEFLPEVPTDPLGTGQLHYQLQADGSPHVWSVGGNFTDDGGLPHFDFSEGDLMWITRPIPGFTEKDFRRH